MKVRITDCTVNSWYRAMINKILDVDENNTRGSGNSLMYKVKNHGADKRIYSKNCIKVNNTEIFPTLKESYNFGD